MDPTVDVDDLVAGRRSALLLLGRGGVGKSEILEALINRAAEANLPTRTLRGHRLGLGDDFGAVEDLLPLDLLTNLLEGPSRLDLIAARRALVDGLQPGVLMVDDAQWIDPASIGLLASVAGGLAPEGMRMVVAHRPRIDRTDLAALDEIMSRHHRARTLTFLDDYSARQRLLSSGLAALGDPVVDQVVSATGGSPSLLSSMAAVAADRPAEIERWLVGDGCPGFVLDAVRAAAAHLSPNGRDLLLALSFGASLTSVELRDLLALDSDRALGDATNELLDEGLLSEDGADVVPLVAEASTFLQPLVERRRHHLRFAEVLAARGGSAVTRAEHLKAAGAPPRDLANACLAAADDLMAGSPDLAAIWLDEAEACGVPPLDLAARRADAHLRSGRPVAAIRVVEPLFSAEAPDRLAGLQRVAVAFFQARRPYQAASVLRQLGPRLSGADSTLASLSARLCLMLSGHADEARDIVSGAPDINDASDPAIEVARLLADAVIEASAGDIEQAVSTAAEASELELTALAEPRLPVSASIVAPMMAVFGADVVAARRFAERAVRAPAATDGQRRGRVLVASLVDVWSGSGPGLDAALDWDELGPFDHLMACAVAAGAARRANDLGRLRGLEERIMQAILLPPDLVTLLPYGELLVAAARLGADTRVNEARVLRDRLFATGEPVAVAEIACCWTDLQVLVASDSHQGLEPLEARLALLDSVGGRPGSLVSAMVVWCELLGRRADPERIVQASRDLQEVGFGWEAARLVGAAALRLDDEEAAKGLLATARQLRSSLQNAGLESAPLSARLSARELEVAELLVGGNTYKEIGARLYISPKTVEHHVAKIRQRLAVSSRAELLDMLRTEFAGD
ncbi:MAG: hypothetical protein GY929_18780 [Actinomycetia bacterium]|nr:hypothetical protein [Actinomycetes bacterium]